MEINLHELQLPSIDRWTVRHRLGASLALGLMVLLTGLAIDTLGQIEALDQARGKEVELRAEFERKQRKVANLDAYTHQLGELEQLFRTLLRQLPDKTQIPELLLDVSQTGATSGLEFDLFKPQPEIRQEFYAELPIEVHVTGRYAQMGAFLDGLANAPRIVTVHNVHIRPASEKEDPAQLSLEATLKTYRYLDEREVQSALPAKR